MPRDKYKRQIVDSIYNQFETMSVIKQIEEKFKNNPIEVDLSSIEIPEFTPEIKELFEKHKKVEVLVMNNCNLTSLKNFPSLPSLQALDLSSNK